MKLHCADILHQLRHKPLIISRPDLMPAIVEPTDRERNALLLPLLPKIHQAQKYWFDSGSDQDAATTTAVRETAVNMMEMGLFHLPHPVIWVEDPFDAEDDAAPRNCYLAMEMPGRIEVWHFSESDVMSMLPPGPDRRKMPKIATHWVKLVIDLNDPDDTFTAQDRHNVEQYCAPIYGQILGETIYSIKKLIVTLATRGTQTEKRAIGPRELKQQWNGDSRTRPYDHTVVRIPTGEPVRDGSGRVVEGVKPSRLTLVAGYQWGKNTRPAEEQRWIMPYWRGAEEFGVKDRSHYEVR